MYQPTLTHPASLKPSSETPRLAAIFSHQRWPFAALAIGMALSPVMLFAQTATQTANVVPESNTQATIQRFLDHEMATATSLGQLPQVLAGRVEVNVGQIDSRLQLAPCARIEPHLPANTRLWGRINIMLRCVQGANWNVSLPVTVRVWGNAVVAARPMQANEAITAADTMLQEIELTREPTTPITSTEQLEQKILARNVAIGTVIRHDMLRAMPVIASGDSVRIIAKGNGFSLTTEGRAMNQAADGQSVRVQTESGRIVSGTARAGRIAEIKI